MIESNNLQTATQLEELAAALRAGKQDIIGLIVATNVTVCSVHIGDNAVLEELYVALGLTAEMQSVLLESLRANDAGVTDND